MRPDRAAAVLFICIAGLSWHNAGPAAVPDVQKPAIALDLSAGSLSQSNCQTAIGCGHPNVTLTKHSLVSEATAGSHAQHILTLQLGNPPVMRGSYTLELEYELANPSGRKSNLLCAGALIKGRLVQRCANPYGPAGSLQVPIDSVPEKIALQFALMPIGKGHRFAVKNVRLLPGQHREPPDKAKSGAIDLTSGRLSQIGCATPIGCRHPSVTITPTTFSSFVSDQAGPPPPAPGDNPNAPSDNPNGLPVQNPAAPTGSAALEVPVPARGRRPSSLRFAYRMEGGGAQAGGRISVTAQGRTIVQSMIDTAGSGIAAIEFPRSSLPIDVVTFRFIPAKGVSTHFEIGDVAMGSHAEAGVALLAASESTTCEGCDPPATRLDPCGPLLETFWVSAADSREGRGIRCVSPDLQAWYGEGWWVDPDFGRYRHLGYVRFRAGGLPSGALSVDFGVSPPPREGDDGIRPAYGTRGPQVLDIELIDFEHLHVFTASRSVDEIWTYVPEGTLLPVFFGSWPWDQQCGNFGLHQFQAASNIIDFQRRCTMPSDLTVGSDHHEHTSLPIVWYGESYLGYGQPDEERTHLGWLTAWPEPDSPVASYAAADRCVLAPLGAPCTTFDPVTMEVLGPGIPLHPPGAPQRSFDGWFTLWQGLYVTGPPPWHDHIWTRRASLPAAASLPLPTPACVDEGDCPN